MGNAEADIGTSTIARGVSRYASAEQTAAHFVAIVESSDDAIISKTLEGIVTSWNPGAERVFGYTADEMIGQPISRLMPPECANDFPTILDTIRRGGRVDHFETERMRKDGERIHVSVTVSPIKDGTGRIVGASKIARDVTGRRRAEEERERLLALAEQARAEAEAASRAKDEFLSMVSHELRTPLASILGWVAVLRQGKLAPERIARALETIDRSGRLQSELIDDLLDVSRIVTGRLKLTFSPVDLRMVARAAVDGLKPEAAAKGVRLETFLDAVPMQGDAVRLQQVVANLVNNGVKFTPPGGTVEVHVQRMDGSARIVVRDTGRGIPQRFLPHVFEAFRQAEDTKKRKEGGLGLGLAIARSLVEQHGGTVMAESAGEGAGSTFTVIIPLGSAAEASAAGRPMELDGPRLDGVRVLVVDDDRDVCDLLRVILEDRGAEVATATSVREARDALREADPNIVVSDLRMSQEDGYVLVREIRASERLHAVPVIAVTAYHQEEDAGRVAAAGFQACLGKPVEPEALIALLASLAAPPARD